jgi:predicted SAM-dependent methyltransferase
LAHSGSSDALFAFYEPPPEGQTLAARALFAALAARSLGGSVAVLTQRTLAREPPAALAPPAPTRPPLGARARARLAAAANRMRRVLTRERLRAYDRLNLGAGWSELPGWANIDLHGRRNLIWDLTRPLPVAPGSIRFIYSEHFIEHIPREACRQLLLNARAALGEEGVLRVSTPDLAFWARTYLEGRRIQHPHAGWFPDTPCAMLNDQMRLWGHQFIYDEAELTRLLRACGFTRIARVPHGQSPHPELQGLESRPACGDLILEARA